MDRGWSWVVCGAAFITHMLTVGFSYGIGVYYVEFLSVFNESKGATAWISSLNYGMLCGIGPIASLLIHRWGHRVTMFTGGIVAALGLMICSFATNLYTVLISFGLITGIGSGLAFTAGVVVISVYYMTLRPLALGLSLAGGGIGNICFPWITSALIAEFGWRGALMITSGLLLHICVGAMLIMKPPQTNPKRTSTEIETKNSTNLDGKKMLKINNNEKDATTNINHNNSVKYLTTSVLTDSNFIILLINTAMFLFGTAVVFTHIMAFAESQGISPSLGNMMISALGLSALIGRIVLSLLSQHPWINTIVLYIIAVFLCGFAIVIMAVWTSPVGLMICSCVFGFFSAAFGPTVAECACLITGPRLFNFGYGYLMVIMGLGWLLGAPAAGLLYDATLHYPNSFYLGGGITMAGALVLIPVAIRSYKNKLQKISK